MQPPPDSADARPGGAPAGRSPPALRRSPVDWPRKTVATLRLRKRSLRPGWGVGMRYGTAWLVRVRWRGMGLLATVAVVAAACGADDTSPPPAVASPPPPATAASPAAAAPYLLFNQRLLEGLSAEAMDFTDADAVFRLVFEALPAEVTVYPSENYYYFNLYAGGRQIWGNIRLPAGRRENGVLSFGYYEFVEFPSVTLAGFTGSRFYSDADGVLVAEVDRFTYTVRFRQKTVTFHLHELDQTPPPSSVLSLSADERFIQRTFDESGYQYYLLYNNAANYFFWVLNEEAPLPDAFDELRPGLLIGRRSGFAFWRDDAAGGRKVLIGVRQLNVRRNDYYDGPFDQLADNYAAETRVAEFMQRAFPSLAGRIDQYGYYTDRDPPVRVALSAYITYAALTDIVTAYETLGQETDPYAFISRGGQAAPAAAGGSGAQDQPESTD